MTAHHLDPTHNPPPPPKERRMTNTPTRYSEAIRWDGTAAGATEIIEWILPDGRANYRCDGDACPGTDDAHRVVIGTLEGDMLASPGDWIIRGVKGEFYPCRDDIFRATYEPA